MLNSLNKIDNIILFTVKRFSPLNLKRSNNNFLFAFVLNHLIYYLIPVNLTYAWSFGFYGSALLATSCLILAFLVSVFIFYIKLLL